MTGFEKVTQEVDEFKKSSLFPGKCNDLIAILKHRPFDKRLVLSSELEKTLRLRGPSIRTIVKNARRMGSPIASCGDGYHYARTAGELEPTIHHIQERRDSLSYTLRALLDCYPNQAQSELKL